MKTAALLPLSEIQRVNNMIEFDPVAAHAIIEHHAIKQLVLVLELVVLQLVELVRFQPLGLVLVLGQ